MSILKKIIFFFLDLLESFRFRKIIKEEDQKKKFYKTQDQFYKKFFDKGFLVLDNYVSSQEVDDVKKKLIFDKKKMNCSYARLIVRPKTIIEKILKDESIKKILINYLGKDVKLDLLEANSYHGNSEKISSSEKWHYDIVGKRIKIFLFLDDCQTIYTEYVDSTNNIFHKYYSSRGSRVTDSFINKKFKKITKIIPKKGSLLIFDTNGFHRGVYRNNKILSENSDRQMIQMEFSSKSKSDKLVNLNCNSIGVRNIFFSKDCDLKDYLIDNNYSNIFLDENFIFYDQEYSTQ